MMRTSFWVLVLALALSACGNDADRANVNAGAANAAAAEAGGNGSAVSQAAQAGASANASGSAAVLPAGGASAIAGMPLGVPLGPILDEDSHSPDKMGCNCMFDAAEGRYLSVIDRELMVRTPAGLKLCPITDAQLQSLGEAGGSVSCGGVGGALPATGARGSGIASDSSTAPPLLSAPPHPVTRTLEGDWGCAC